MAVLHELPGIKVTVEVDGRCAYEYEDQDGPADDRSTGRANYRNYRYIESRDDAHFSVVYDVDNTHGKVAGHSALGFYLMLDGTQMDSALWEESRYPGGGGIWSHTVKGARGASGHSGMDSFRKFKFSKVTTVDDVEKERVENDIKESKSLGLIQVLVYSVEVRHERYTSLSLQPVRQGKSFEVAEKALKGRAVSHGTSYSDAGLIPHRHAVSVDFKGSNPIAAYNFKYRSRDALHKELIIPRSPSPANISGLSDAEIRRLAMERLEDVNVCARRHLCPGELLYSLKQGRRSPTIKREEKGPLIKREYQEFCDLTGDPSKREWKKIKIDENHEAIDLTDD